MTTFSACRYDSEVTSLSVALHEQTKILFGQLNCSVKLADVSTRCSSRPKGKSEARCEKGGALIGVASALARPCGICLYLCV